MGGLTDWNLGGSVLILGSVYFGYAHGFAWWIDFLILAGLFTLAFPLDRTKERDALIKARTEYLAARAEYYRKKAVQL